MLVCFSPVSNYEIGGEISYMIVMDLLCRQPFIFMFTVIIFHILDDIVFSLFCVAYMLFFLCDTGRT